MSPLDILEFAMGTGNKNAVLIALLCFSGGRAATPEETP